MNYLSCMLRLIVCLYLGFASIPAIADDGGMAARNADREARSEAKEKAARIAAAEEAEAREKAARSGIMADSSDELIKKAWSCNPILHEKKIANWKLRQTKVDGGVESVEEGYARLYGTLLEFRGCQNEENKDQLRKAFIEKYVCGLKSSNRSISERDELDVANKKPGAIQIAEYEDVIISGFIPCNGTKGKGAYYLDLKQYEVEARQPKVKSGAIPISSFDDAILFYEPKSLWGVMASPLLTPDKSVYSGIVVLDGQENKNTLLVKFNAIYATLKLTKKTVNYLQEGLRINGDMNVIGRYVKNQKYTTVSGEGKTMPVLEVMYIGAWDYLKE